MAQSKPRGVDRGTVTRKVCGGNRSSRGARTQEILLSVLRTLQQRRLDAATTFVDLLRSPVPTATLAPPASVE